jgi:hypothetical protein
MANEEARPESDAPEADEGFKEYVAQIDPGTAAEMEALIEQLEVSANDPPPPPAAE